MWDMCDGVGVEGGVRGVVHYALKSTAVFIRVVDTYKAQIYILGPCGSPGVYNMCVAIHCSIYPHSDWVVVKVMQKMLRSIHSLTLSTSKISMTKRRVVYFEIVINYLCSLICYLIYCVCLRTTILVDITVDSTYSLKLPLNQRLRMKQMCRTLILTSPQSSHS